MNQSVAKAVKASAVGSVSVSDDVELRVIHALRLRGFASVAVIAEVTGLTRDVVDSALVELSSGRLVMRRDAPTSGYMLLPVGRRRGEILLADEVDRLGVRDALEAQYARFLELNRPFLHLCTEWQVKDHEGDQTINDHLDESYDAAMMERLAATNAEIQPICRELAASLDRFHSYGPRFGAALERVRNGDIDWFTGAMIDSYHTVWFELHEDLLASLGIERLEEAHT